MACSGMLCLTKEPELHLKMMVCTVLLLNSLVSAQNNSAERNNELHNGELQTNSLALFLATSIENATLQANLHALNTADKFEFLYLHGRSNHVEFDNEEVKSKLGSFVREQDYTYPASSAQAQVYRETDQNRPTPQNEVAENGSPAQKVALVDNPPTPQNEVAGKSPSPQNEALTDNAPALQNEVDENGPPHPKEALDESQSPPQNKVLADSQTPSQNKPLTENNPPPQNDVLDENIQNEREEGPPQPEDDTDYRPPPPPENKYQPLSQDLTENDSTPQNSERQDTFLDETSFQKQPANKTNFKLSVSVQATNTNTSQNSELNQPMSFTSLETGEASVDATAQYNLTHYQDYSRIYLQQQQEEQGQRQKEEQQQRQQQRQAYENTTPRQVSFQSSSSTTSYTYPAILQQPFNQTYSQDTADTQQQNYYSPADTQQPGETVPQLQTASTNSSVMFENPRFAVEQQYMNDETQGNPTRQEENINATEENSSPNLFQEQGKTINQHTREYGYQQGQNPNQDGKEQASVQKNTDSNLLWDEELHQYSAAPQADQQLFPGEENLNQELQQTALASTQSQQESFYDQNTTVNLFNSSQSQNELRLFPEQNEPNLSPQNTTNSQDIERNLLNIQRDPNIMKSLLSRVSRFRNEYELATQQFEADTADNSTQHTELENQGIYRRSRIEKKEKIRRFLRTTKVNKNSKDQTATRTPGNLIRRLLNKNDNFEAIWPNSQTNEGGKRVESHGNSKRDNIEKWINNLPETNFLIRFSKEQKNKNAKGIPEHELLMRLEAMRYEFLEKHNECPTFVIFGTNSEACYILAADRNNCAEEFLEVKEAFKRSCANTKFYIYARKGKEETIPFQSVQTLTKNGVSVLIS